ncbi:MAG: alpha-2-macroglobulin [Rhodospirillaceae bacterium]|nr:alpha-2-macroglobulin [Rhodospirillaceae bacterium]
MQRKAKLALGAAVIGVLAIWALWAPPSTPSKMETASSSANTPAAATAETLPPVRTQAASDKPVPAGTLAFRRIIADTRGDTPEACLLFSSDLDGSGDTRYADYLRISGGVDAGRAGLRVVGARLCLSGLGFGGSYTVTLKRGLPAANGATLAEDTEVPVDFGDRPASVSFPGGFILPRESTEGLPITTVNTDSLDLAIYRVGDRLLARMRQDFVDDSTIYSYRLSNLISQDARAIWTGKMPVSGPRNDKVTSVFPISEALGKAEPGAYLVTARISGDDADRDSDGDYHDTAVQWVVRSDLGLTSFSGGDGLSIVVRSLASAKPVAGVRLTLIARNNDELAQAVTGSDGIARFDPGLMRGPGGAAPAMVMAYAGEDFNFIDLRRVVFDLSDRGVSGRDVPRGADAFLYADRGIYRPGETVHLTALLRNQTADALTGRSLVLKVHRPDGREYRRFVVPDAGGGAGTLDLELPKAAPRGGWEITAHADPEGSAIGRLDIDVQDFVPQRLAVDIEEKPEQLEPGADIALPIAVRFLYGAPAAGLTGEGTVTVEADPSPFPAYKGYRWGNKDERFSSASADLELAPTDAEGHTEATGSLPEIAATTLPLLANIHVAIHEPGGRSTPSEITVPVRPLPLYLGLRPLFDDSVREGTPARFEAIAVNATGTRVAAAAEWRIFRDASTWQWFRSSSQWRYERIQREIEVASGRLDLDAEKPVALEQTLSWGRYRLEMRNPASGAVTSVRFYSGWYGDSAADRPDRLKIAADKPGYRPGETARLRIESETAGEALLVIANERVHEIRNIPIPAGGGEIAVTVAPEWGAGAYALVTLYQPLSAKSGHAPVRAVGVSWLGLNPAERTLAIDIGTPEQIAPRQKLDVPVRVTGANGTAHVTLAAVDQGILQLTHFKTPDPAAYYLGKRSLGVGMRDDYGRLIRGLAANGEDSGGDAFGSAGLDVVPTRSVALFSGIVALDKNGAARIPLDIPDFQGELRLMAVAFDATKVGSAESRLTVRDPVVADVILPRFLSPGDQAAATVTIHNVSGVAGEYRVRVSASNTVTADDTVRTIELAVGRREDFTVPLSAGATGIGEIRLAVDGPQGFSAHRDWPIQVRAAQLPHTVQNVSVLAPGASETLGVSLLSTFLPGSAHASVSLSRWAGLDVPGLLRWLDRYPFGCLEQTTSRAMPLLDFNDIALLAGGAEDRGIDARLQEAIERIAAMQTEDGGFHMWGPWGSEANPWISVFALDFLYRAADKGYDVPAATLALGRRFLGNTITGGSRQPERDARAYAAAVLARRGLANPAELRYLHDETPPKAPLALAHLGAALTAVGEQSRASSAFAKAIKALDDSEKAKKPENYRSPYGGRLRDIYAMAALFAESGRAAQIPDLLDRARALDSRAESTTTQDKAWMLRFAAATSQAAGRLSVEADGTALSGDPVLLPLTPEGLKKGVVLRNTSKGEIFSIVTVDGVPADPLPPERSGMTLTKSVFYLDGRQVNLTETRRNDRFVVLLEGRLRTTDEGTYAVQDLLPSGWEIEATLRPDQVGYDWAGPLSAARVQEARDDRYLAAIDMPDDEPVFASGRSEDKTFRLAYVVRAVTPGDFALPAATAGNMYVPGLRARTAMGRLIIAP